MAELPPSYAQCGCTTAQADRQVSSSLVCYEGVANTGQLQVTAPGGTMTVNVAAGNAFVQGDDAAWQGMYHVSNDATDTLNIPASDPVDPRTDLIVAQIRDSTYTGANCDWQLLVVQGTAGPGAPVPPTPPSALILARVAVAAGATSISAGNITDYRVAYGLCSADRPGSIELFASDTIPSGWVACIGTALNRSVFARLFAVIGTTFGVGDGSTTFNVPDLRDRFPVGKGVQTQWNVVGETGGSSAAHDHGLTDAAAAINIANPVGGDATATFTQQTATTVTPYATNFNTIAVSGPTASGDTTTGVNIIGDTDETLVLPPYMALNFIIRT